MAWSVSAIFQQAMKNPMTASLAGTSNVTLPVGYSATGGLVADTLKVAVYNNTTAPDKTAAVASTGFGAGTWSGNEITGTGWSSGGVSVGTTKTYTLDSGSSSFCYQVTAPVAGQTSTPGVSLSAFYGCLVYDSTISGGTVANQGMCFNYFGGSQTITAGTFTILWATPASAAVTAIFNISV